MNPSFLMIATITATKEQVIPLIILMIVVAFWMGRLSIIIRIERSIEAARRRRPKKQIKTALKVRNS